MKLLVTPLIILLFTLNVSGQNAAKTSKLFKDVNVTEFARLIKEQPGVILDVRTKGEVEKGAIPKSINLDIFGDNFESQLNKLDKSKPVYVYCASGGRSAEAMEMMSKNGFKAVYNLEGGYSAWKKSLEK